MNTIVSLERKMEALTEEVRDIFHATSLNIEALLVQSENNNSFQGVLKEIEKDFEHAKDMFKNREQLRLNYLITEQIKEEEAKVRRQRLMEYEQKIYDQRRLISDKEAFYESLYRPKKKKPQNMTSDEFQEIRRKQQAEEEERNLKLLTQQISQLETLEGILDFQNKKLAQITEQNEKEVKRKQINEPILKLARKNPHIYAIMKKNPSNFNMEKMKEMIETIYTVKQQNVNLIKQMKQEMQMQQYLKWQHQKLLQQYKTATNNLQKESQSRASRIFTQNSSSANFQRAVSI